MKHFLIAVVLVILVTAGMGFGLANVGLLPRQASAQAVPIDVQFQFHFWAIAFLFSLIVVFMLYSVVVFRRRAGDESDGEHIEGNQTLEITWTIVPLFVVIGVAIWGSQVLAETRRVDPGAIEVDVIAAQWSWRFDYPEHGFSSSELVLPVNQQALLRLSSKDVIHSFWVPEFRVKQDALPGDEEMVRELRVTPTEIGDYRVRCAELCGPLHSQMLAPVVVLSEENFDSWVADQLAALSADPVVRGQAWSEQFGCAACHSFDGSEKIGPTWQGLFGRDE